MMAKFRYLDLPKMDEGQAISLIIKHFPISIQAYIQSTQEKKFLNIWKKLGGLENGKKERVDDNEQTDNIQNEPCEREVQTPEPSQTPENYYGQTTQRTQESPSRYDRRPTGSK